MANEIKINKDFKLKLNFEIQTSPRGRPMLWSGLCKNEKKPSKWRNRTEYWHWIYCFKFLDEKSGFISFEFDFFDNYVCTLKK